MSDVSQFATYIDSERQRLTAQTTRLQEQRTEIDRQLAWLAREEEAINAYESVKAGKTAPVGKTLRATTANRVRAGSRRETIIRAVAGAPDGLSRGELIELFGLKADKNGEMSISNALTALTKGGQLYRDRGRYYVPVANQRHAAE